MIIVNQQTKREVIATARAYVLFHVVDGNAEKVVHSLRSQPGVMVADVLEDSSDVIMVVEASARQRLAELAIQALVSVESLTEDLRLLPARSL